jgi:hypothetical protein
MREQQTFTAREAARAQVAIRSARERVIEGEDLSENCESRRQAGQPSPDTVRRAAVEAAEARMSAGEAERTSGATTPAENQATEDMRSEEDTRRPANDEEETRGTTTPTENLTREVTRQREEVGQAPRDEDETREATNPTEEPANSTNVRPDREHVRRLAQIPIEDRNRTAEDARREEMTCIMQQVLDEEAARGQATDEDAASQTNIEPLRTAEDARREGMTCIMQQVLDEEAARGQATDEDATSQTSREGTDSDLFETLTQELTQQREDIRIAFQAAERDEEAGEVDEEGQEASSDDGSTTTEYNESEEEENLTDSEANDIIRRIMLAPSAPFSREDDAFIRRRTEKLQEKQGNHRRDI